MDPLGVASTEVDSGHSRRATKGMTDRSAPGRQAREASRDSAVRRSSVSHGAATVADATLDEDATGPIPLRLLPENSEIAENGHLRIGGCDVIDLAREYGTPLFIYDEAHLRSRCQDAVSAFGRGTAYAGKAFLCSAMARLAILEGLDIDVCSLGELETVFRAFRNDAPVDLAQRIVMHGNNKSDEELTEARRKGVGRIVVDSFDELDRLERLHRDDGEAPRVLLRVTPGVQPETHKFISTGQVDSKFGFGISGGVATEAVRRAASSTSVELIGIHCHIGSQLLDIDKMLEALDAVAEFAAPLFGSGGIADGCLEEMSIGGGLGVAYVESQSAPTIAAWGKTLNARWDVLKERYGLGARLVAEPGRAIAAQAAITVYEVGSIKRVPSGPTYVAVDGGFSDNLRPMLYGGNYTAFMPARATAPRPDEVSLVGRYCESGDVIVPSAQVPNELTVGDFVATPVTGAYGYSMGAPYHRVGRPAVVFAANGDARRVIRREKVKDMLALDVL
ncbi:diaminopimelate decarboxylase [Candidatus Poriferisodalis sp.]|uniref:diaminopimelate decarboxylase n=1 Tax=Candidatus Poriferisodalis sp. TaxID=3101277 RepID=UPI003B02CA34